MARFISSMQELQALEHSSDSNVLHHNKGERGYTYWGIYEVYNRTWNGWHEVYRTLKKCKYDMRKSSKLLYKDKTLTRKVYEFYKAKYWTPLKLDAINSQKIADEIFCFAVNTNKKRAIKKAQKIVGVKVDGWIGAKTIYALNHYNVAKFDIEFDYAEIAFYKYLAFISKRKNHYRKFYHGWVNRAKAV